MDAGYTKDDAMFQSIDKTGGGIKVGTVLEQENGQKYKLIQGIDIDWNKAKLSYIYAATSSYISDTSDLLHLIDEISHGNSIGWEIYGGAPPITTVQATFVDYDGTELETHTIDKGQTPIFEGTTPSRQDSYDSVENIGTEYTFNGWSPEIGPINANTTFTAQYSEKAFRMTTKYVKVHSGGESAGKEYIFVSSNAPISTNPLNVYVSDSWTSGQLFGAIPGTIDTTSQFSDLEEFAWTDTPLTTFIGLEQVPSSTYFYMKDLSDDGYLIANSSANTFAAKGTSTDSATNLWEWKLVSGTDEIVCNMSENTRYIQYNYNNGNQPRFAPYKHTMKTTYLFEKSLVKEYINRRGVKTELTIPEFIVTGHASYPIEPDKDIQENNQR